ncbi:glycosyl hydrolase family 3 N terminal domain-containing protein [Ilyonectria sp. MPI-CAGE-AT-0026]|nr:glycosyl hydrolase family 3 N terminal domain-containing protein [Ilyonectria sp. MPI-CAGE-AT-0026]
MHVQGLATTLVCAIHWVSAHASSVKYPAGLGLDETKWGVAREKANDLIARMNLTEKAMMVTGTLDGTCIEYVAPITRIGFGGLCLQDGPNALRTADKASVFPAGLTTAATWDKKLMYARGSALAQEFRDKGAHVALGPVAGPLGRSPWGGRNWEGFSPDPYLTGVAVDLTIRATQEIGVQATVKHLIGNEQETQRKPTLIDGVMVDAVSSNIDDRTMHELYLWPFADAVHAGVSSVMCSYNRINGSYGCENSKLVNDLLKGELGFEGYVSSDFFATRSGVQSAKAGLDLNVPGPIAYTNLGNTYFGANLVTGVQNGTLSSSRLDDMVRRVLMPYYYLGQDEGYPSVDPSTYYLVAQFLGVSPRDTLTPAGRDVRSDHGELIREIAAAGTVLLKNDNGILPLKNTSNLAVFGNDAADPTSRVYSDGGPNIGTLVIGGGAGSGRNSYVVSPLDAIKSRAKKLDVVQFITHNTILAEGDFSSIYPQPAVCLLFLKTWAEEGYDRTTLEADDDSSAVVAKVASFCPKRTVVITHSGGVNIMPWASNPNISAILAAHYPGQESGNSIADILFGDVNPSGKLPYTIAKQESDYNTPVLNLTGPDATNSSAWQSDFVEGLLIDYRHFDAMNITPQYEFGHGLSYTTFDITDASVVKQKKVTAFPAATKKSTMSLGGNANLWNTLLTVPVTVSNTGSLSGAAVPQIYVSLPQDEVPSGTPVQILRGFDKPSVRPGKEQSVKFALTRRDVSFWDVEAQNWRIPKGKIELHIGFSSRDIRKTLSVELL